MSYLRTQRIRYGRLQGEVFGTAYSKAREPKAVVVCIDWSTTEPNRVNRSGVAKFQFVTGDGSDRPTTKAIAKRLALRDLGNEGGCRKGLDPVVVDVNGRNAIDPPRNWLTRYGTHQ